MRSCANWSSELAKSQLENKTCRPSPAPHNYIRRVRNTPPTTRNLGKDPTMLKHYAIRFALLVTTELAILASVI